MGNKQLYIKSRSSVRRRQVGEELEMRQVEQTYEGK